MIHSPPPMKPGPNETVAFWLQLEPYQALVGEGIGQHLSHMLGGWAQSDAGKALLLAPVWSRGAIEELIDTYDLPRDRIQARYFGPTLLAGMLRGRTRPRIHETESIEYALANRLEKLPAPWLLTMLLAPLAPFVLLMLLVVKLLGGRGKGLARSLVSRAMLLVRATSFASMAAYINRTPSISFCIVPIGNWSLCRLVRSKPLVVQIPDVVFLEFPEFFDKNSGVNALAREIEKVARRANAVISPSAFVREKHIVGFLGVPPDRAFVVPHAPMLLASALAKLMPQSDPPTRLEARRELASRWDWIMQRQGYIDRLGGSLHWLARIKSLPLLERRLVYFPTQYRPYKNIERAIEAIAALANEPGPPITLLLTADLSGAPGVLDLIERLGLRERVIPLPRLSQPYHALLNAAADLVLCASRFEGGFPFQPGEALSVGTPFLLADIPIVRATIPPNMRARVTFQPENVEHLASSMRRALNDPELCLEQSRWFYAFRRDRNWTHVLNDYLNAGRAAAAGWPLQDTAMPPKSSTGEVIAPRRLQQAAAM